MQEQADELSAKISDLAKHEKKLVRELEVHEDWIDAEVAQVEQTRAEMVCTLCYGMVYLLYYG